MPIIAVAPMLDLTTRHFRYFMRQITQHTILYTEMIVADAIIHGNRNKLLGFDHCELPLIVQLGGSEPNKLAVASKICADFGYSGINLNVGCPSSRVKSGNFGACLMHDAQLVASCIKSMQDSVTIPVSIKQRIGLDHMHDYDFLAQFVDTIAKTGCKDFIIHARNAILNGLSPKQNREIPPLNYDYVYRLKQDFAQLNIIVNGGIKTLAHIETHLQLVDGVMLGREAYNNPYLFSSIEQCYFDTTSTIPTRKEIAYAMIHYLEQAVSKQIPLQHITKHMLGLYYGQSKARFWRQQLTEIIAKTNDLDMYIELLKQLPFY